MPCAEVAAIVKRTQVARLFIIEKRALRCRADHGLRVAPSHRPALPDRDLCVPEPEIAYKSRAIARPPSHLPITQRHAARRSAGCCFIHSASCGTPIRQDCIETSAKSEVVTVCSQQFAGDKRLQSTAMISITAGAPRRDGHWRRQVPCPAAR